MKTRVLCIIIFIVSSIIFLYFVSCANNGNEPPTCEITGWCVENIDESFWTKWGYTGGATAYFDIWVEASDPDGIDDITYVKVTNPEGTYWVLRDSETGKDHYDPEGGFFGGWRRYYSADHPHRVLLGQYTALVRDSKGNEATDTLSFNEPGSLSGSGFLYSEDYTGSTSGGKKMLQRAVITNAIKDISDITIEFTVNDTRVYNGWVWFYDVSTEYITWSDFFKNTINSGAGLYTDGFTTNILQIHPTDLDLGTFTWNDISGFHIVLTDGLQYSPKEDLFDHFSISAYELF